MMKKKLIIYKIFILYLILVPVWTSVLYYNERYMIGLDSNALYRPLRDFSFLVALLVFSKSLRNEFKKRLILSKKVIRHIVLYPILIGFILNFILESSRFIPPLMFKGDIIKIGTSQATNTFKDFSLASFIFTGLFPAVNEELYFRFVFYSGLSLFLKSSPAEDIATSVNKIVKVIKKIGALLRYVHTKLFIQRNKSYVVIWIIATSSYFSYMHGPDITNFYLYFIPGFVFAMLFLKYGLVASMVAHCFSNYLNPIFWMLVNKFAPHILSSLIYFKNNT